MSVVLSVSSLNQLVTQVFLAHGTSLANAGIVAEVVANAERDGAHGHGLLRLPGYVSTLQSGWVNGRSKPQLSEPAPGLLAADGCNGFAQVALAVARERLTVKCRQQGIAALAIHNSHHFAALWPDVEGFARAGFVAIAFVNSRSRIVPSGGSTKLFGSNPMAFACPRRNAPPMVWDQASSVVSQGELLVASREGRQVPTGAGVDRAGMPSTDPRAILDGGALLPFGQHKGSSIALMVEIMAAALTGGRFGFEDASPSFPGAQTSNAGELVILVDPGQTTGRLFTDRVEQLFELLVGNGNARLPGERRYRARRHSEEHGIEISDEIHRSLLGLGAASAQLGGGADE